MNNKFNMLYLAWNSYFRNVAGCVWLCTIATSIWILHGAPKKLEKCAIVLRPTLAKYICTHSNWDKVRAVATIWIGTGAGYGIAWPSLQPLRIFVIHFSTDDDDGSGFNHSTMCTKELRTGPRPNNQSEFIRQMPMFTHMLIAYAYYLFRFSAATCARPTAFKQFIFFRSYTDKP